MLLGKRNATLMRLPSANTFEAAPAWATRPIPLPDKLMDQQLTSAGSVTTCTQIGRRPARCGMRDWSSMFKNGHRLEKVNETEI